MIFDTLPPKVAPLVIIAVAIAVRAAVAWQRELTWTEYVFAHGAKGVLFPLLQRLSDKSERLPTLPLVSTKGGHEDTEYLGTAQESVTPVVSALRQNGHELHLVNSLKRRDAVYRDSGYEYSIAHTRYVHDDGMQTECYLFTAPNGVDVYAHMEPGVEDPENHLDIGQQVDGDPRGVVPQSLF